MSNQRDWGQGRKGGGGGGRVRKTLPWGWILDQGPKRTQSIASLVDYMHWAGKVVKKRIMKWEGLGSILKMIMKWEGLGSILKMLMKWEGLG